MIRSTLRRLLPVPLVVVVATSAGAATFVLEIDDPPNQGFNDPSSRAKVAGNPGTTLGEQRVFAFEAALQEWGNRLVSRVDVRVKAGWGPLECTNNDGLVGMAGVGRYFRNFPGAPKPKTWYPWALANALSGADRAPAVQDGHIEITLNDDLGSGGCLSSLKWDYRVGVPAGGRNVSLFVVTLHEVAHGLGFGTLVDTSNGSKAMGFNDAYMLHLEDHSLGKTWDKMTNAQRLASLTDDGDLHFIGPSALLHSTSLAGGRNDPGSHVLVHAPSQLDDGISVNHLDLSLSSGNLDDLMEPRLGPRLDPILTDHILQDLGWPVSHPTVRTLEDIDGAGAPNDAAVLLVGQDPPRHEVQVIDATSLEPITVFGLAADVSALDMGVVTNYRNTAASEIAVLTWRTKGRLVRVFVHDASSGNRIRILSFQASYPKSMVVVPSYTGSSADEIAIFTVLASGAIKVIVKDVQSGATVTNQTYPSAIAGAFGVLPSIGGSAAPDFVVAYVDPTTGTAMMEVRDATSGATLTSSALPMDFLPTDLAVLENFGGTAAGEVAFLGVKRGKGQPQVVVVDAGSGAVLRTKTYSDRFHPRGIEAIADYAGTPAQELVILGRRASNLRTRLLVIDASSGAALTTTTVAQKENPHDLAVIPNLAGSAADDVLLLTTNVAEGDVKVFAKDARGQTLGSRVVGGDDGGGGGGANAFTFTQIQSQVFTATCALAGCHNAGSQRAGLNLSAGASFGELVGVASSQRPALNRVQPNQPDNSYLIKKLRGDSDIQGSRMPSGAGGLSQTTMDRIIAWINEGAPNN
ncbi:MAG: hypothetical protein VYE73_09100 [Acidobacteriota bacterium]|nr:hypothetical protein [Acidobacteriota bacterium]